ncbi:polysaccharide pyruvyl transferase family protein [Rhizobium rhizosphaerae]|nr:polysaccharide pyruvyl transferase family protein [Xaviernesmea rhizosphaerae]
MKTNALAEHVRAGGVVPLSWAGSTQTMDYLNIGDALSPVMVALLSGRDVARVPSQSDALRMACVGTIGHGFSGGEVWFWGTGCSNRLKPSSDAPPEAYQRPDNANFRVLATRGPVSEQLLTGEAEGSIGVYGDPVWLLPRFYRPSLPKRWKLGVIVHLSELSDRDVEAHVKEELLRYRVPPELAGEIRLINTVAPIGMAGIRDKIDEILSCERIVSTSLHGLVFAESYGIPCLSFPAHLAGGLQEVDLRQSGILDLRIVDLYRGLGLDRLVVYGQPAHLPTDWPALMAAIDQTWREKPFDAEALIAAFPLDLNPLQAPADGTIWDHPLLTGLTLQHDVRELNRKPKPQEERKGGWLSRWLR